MELTPVNSSSIAAVAYDEATQTLRIRFTSLAEYEYANVPKEVFETLMHVEGKGSYWASIRERFPFTCVVARPKKEKTDEEAPAKEKPAKAKASPKRTPI